MHYYLNKKRRQLVGFIFLKVNGAIPPEGYLFREFDYDKPRNIFVFKRETMISKDAGEARLKDIRGNSEWAPIPPITVEKFVDYKTAPKGGASAVQERKAEKVHVVKAS